MPRRARVPEPLRHGPFHVRDAARLGITDDHLRGRSYRRLLPRVWVHVEHEMTPECWWLAATLHAPTDARFTGATRLQQLGLDLGPHLPLQMVVPRDLHRDVADVVLHRTDRLPEHDGRGVSPTAAFVEVCRWFPLLDAVAAGDWLLAQGHMTPRTLSDFCRHDDWRAGTVEAMQVARLLDSRARSIPESHARIHFWSAGIPAPEVNAPIEVDGRVVAIADWLWRPFRAAAEYEGGHHQSDRSQYLVDVRRYETFRRLGLQYVQLTREDSPVAMVLAVHRLLVACGYDGPPPAFDARFRWTSLPVPEALALMGLAGADPTRRHQPLYTDSPSGR